jgi:hypothetical protein
MLGRALVVLLVLVVVGAGAVVGGVALSTDPNHASAERVVRDAGATAAVGPGTRR